MDALSTISEELLAAGPASPERTEKKRCGCGELLSEQSVEAVPEPEALEAELQTVLSTPESADLLGALEAEEGSDGAAELPPVEQLLAQLEGDVSVADLQVAEEEAVPADLAALLSLAKRHPGLRISFGY